LIAQARQTLPHRLKRRKFLVALFKRTAFADVLVGFTFRRSAAALFVIAQGSRSAAVLHGETLTLRVASLQSLPVALMRTGHAPSARAGGDACLAQRRVCACCNGHRFAAGQASKHRACIRADVFAIAARTCFDRQDTPRAVRGIETHLVRSARLLSPLTADAGLERAKHGSRAPELTIGANNHWFFVCRLAVIRWRTRHAGVTCGGRHGWSVCARCAGDLGHAVLHPTRRPRAHRIGGTATCGRCTGGGRRSRAGKSPNRLSAASRWRNDSYTLIGLCNFDTTAVE